MGRSSLLGAIENRSRVLAYRAENPTVGYGTIARHLGFSRSYVQQVCNGSIKASAPIDLRLLRERAVAIKQRAVAANRRFGVLSVISELVTVYGYNPDDLPSQIVFEKWFYCENALSVAQVGLKGKSKGRYWFETRPTHHGQRVLIDTAMIKVAGISCQLVVLVDWFSRVAHAEILPFRFMAYLPWVLRRSFVAMGGIPALLQSDNGIGLTNPAIGVYSRVQRYAFSHGVQRWEYVPVSEACRNGRVEKLNDTIKDALDDAIADGLVPNLDAARAWLCNWLEYYNLRRFHHGISRRRKGGLRTPASLGCYSVLPVEVPSVIAVVADATGVVGYKRLVVDGVVSVDYPDFVVGVSHGLTGHYATVWIESDLSGWIEWADADGPHVVARFSLSKRQTMVRATVEPGMEARFAPIAFDADRYLRSTAKARKDRLPRPGSTVAGLCKVLRSDGTFSVVDELTAEVIYDSACGVLPDHATELLGVC